MAYDARKYFTLGAALAAALLATNVALTFRNTRTLNDDTYWVAHTHSVMTQLTSVLSLMKDVETGQRGFVITGEERYLEPYVVARANLAAQVKSLQNDTRDSEVQKAHIPELQRRIDAKMGEVDAVIAARRKDGFEAARAAVMTDAGKAEMDSLRDLVGEMLEHEKTQLATRSEISDRMYDATLREGLVSGLSALAALIALVILLTRHATARAKAARIIAEQAERLRTTLASIGDAVITTDVEGRVTNMNAVAESLTAWTNAQAAGRPLDEVFRIVNEDTRATVPSPATRALREGVIVGLANHTILLAKDGSELGIDDSAAPIRCAAGEIVGCVLVFRDITERRRADNALRQNEEQLRLLLDEQRVMSDELRRNAADMAEADRRKDEFLAMLAHELRNPLAPIRHALQILRMSNGDAAGIRESSDVMERQVGQLVRLVDDLLDVSRISHGKIQLHRAHVELATVVSQAVETCRPAIDLAKHTLTVTLPPEPIVLNADSIRLAQVFTNLLDNACKYSDPGGQISLTAVRERDEVVVTVKDAGVGIPAEMLPHVFDMFMQVDRSMERPQSGLGIGLTLVQRLVEAHQGRVTAASDGLGRGSTFVVRLPVVLDATATSSPANTVEPERSATRRILVVDDNVDSARSLAVLLKLLGNETAMSHDGLAAIDVARTFRPDVIFLDIGLPRLNGYEVARKLRDQSWGKSIALFALTGWGHDEDRQKSKDAGFDVHLVKPVDHAELVRLLAELPTMLVR